MDIVHASISHFIISCGIQFFSWREDIFISIIYTVQRSSSLRVDSVLVFNIEMVVGVDVDSEIDEIIYDHQKSSGSLDTSALNVGLIAEDNSPCLCSL